MNIEKLARVARPIAWVGIGGCALVGGLVGAIVADQLWRHRHAG